MAKNRRKSILDISILHLFSFSRLLSLLLPFSCIFSHFLSTKHYPRKFSRKICHLREASSHHFSSNHCPFGFFEVTLEPSYILLGTEPNLLDIIITKFINQGRSFIGWSILLSKLLLYLMAMGKSNPRHKEDWRPFQDLFKKLVLLNIYALFVGVNNW